GLYSTAWPTMVEEKWLDRAEEGVRRGVVEWVALDRGALRTEYDRLAAPAARAEIVDEAAVAELVMKPIHEKDPGARAAIDYVDVLLADARKWEYQFPGRESLTGRFPLPPSR